MTPPATRCLWCVPGLDDAVYDNADPETFCFGHLAEWEGMPEVELVRYLAETWAESQADR